ncbi:hypothetical protein H8E52_12880, partial [bacterium]|nr:hypothetical protein [bacterium]
DVRSDAELEEARADYREAYEGGDSDALLKGQEKMSRLHAERVGTLSKIPVSATAPAAAPAAAPAPAAPDTRAMKWLRENAWFQAPGSEDMTGYAVGLHQKLIAGGLNPQIHEEYYTRIDEGLRAVFPEKFSSADLGGGEAELPAATTGKKPPPLGGPTRGGKPPRKVQLTTTQVALAKRLGLTNKQYAAQVVKEQMADG